MLEGQIIAPPFIQLYKRGATEVNMGSSTVSVSFVVAVGGFVVVSFYALLLQFQKWQIQKAFQMLTTQEKAGGSIFRTIGFIFVAIVIGLIFFG